MNYSADLKNDTKEMLTHGVVLAVIVVFWTAVSQLAGFGVSAANLNRGLASSAANAFYTVGIANAVLYVLVKAARAHKK